MLIVKIGGGADIAIEKIAADLATLDQPLIVVHGANALRNRIAKQLGVPIQEITSISGFTSVYSDEELLRVMMMTYSGLANKSLVQTLQKHGLNAIGLTGLDGGLVRGKRNPGIRTRIGDKKVIRRDLSGKPKTVAVDLLNLLLEQGYLPVLTVPILDEHGVAINAENDEIVAVLHKAMTADRIIQLIEAPGLLADKDDPHSLIQKLSAQELAHWESQCQGRMRRKLKAIGKLFEHGTPTVHIADGRIDKPLTAALRGEGTVIG